MADEAQLVKERKDLTSKLEAEPRVPQCEHLREQLHIQILDTKCDVTMWTQRLNKLRDLNLNLKPVYDIEQGGRFDPLTFPLEASQSLYSIVHRNDSRVNTASSHSAASPTGSRAHSPEREIVAKDPFSLAATPTVSSPPVTGSGLQITTATGSTLLGESVAESYSSLSHVVSMALKPTDIAELMEVDGSLAAALAPLRGKESTLLTVMPEDEEKKVKKWTSSKSAKFVAPPRDQNMIAWVTLKVRTFCRDNLSFMSLNNYICISFQIVDIWEESRMENERLKGQKFKLLEHLLTTLHSDGAVAALTSFTTQQRSMRSAASPTGLTSQASGVLSLHSEAHSSPSNHLSAIQESEQSSQTLFYFDGRSVEKEESAQGYEKEIDPDASQTAEMAELLASGAQQILTLPPLRNTTKQVDVPLLPLKHPSETTLDPRGGMLHTSKQQERDWIESGDLDEENIASLWDEAFTMPPLETQYGASETPVTTWLQRVPAAKRYPTNDRHMEDAPTFSPSKKLNTLGSKGKRGLHESREGFNAYAEGGRGGSVVSTHSLPAKTLTAKLLCKDVLQLSTNYNVGPPVMLDSGNETPVKRSQDLTKQRSGTLPQLSFSLTANRELQTPLHERVEDSGLKVTEEGLLLKDPLMGKKFAQTQKVVVKNAIKQSAALKKTAELQMTKAKSEAALAHGIDPTFALSVKVRKDKHSMSSDLIHQKNHK